MALCLQRRSERVEELPDACSELVKLDGEGHLHIGHDAHSDEDAKHDERVCAYAEAVLNVGWDEPCWVWNLHALCKQR